MNGEPHNKSDSARTTLSLTRKCLFSRLDGMPAYSNTSYRSKIPLCHPYPYISLLYLRLSDASSTTKTACLFYGYVFFSSYTLPCPQTAHNHRYPPSSFPPRKTTSKRDPLSFPELLCPNDSQRFFG